MITPAIAASTPSNCSPPSIEMMGLLPGRPDAFGVMVTTEASTANVTFMPHPRAHGGPRPGPRAPARGGPSATRATRWRLLRDHRLTPAADQCGLVVVMG